MASYVVMEPAGTANPSGEAVPVRDGFSWLAFLVPPLWLLWHRLWVEALLAALLLAVLSGVGEIAGFGLTAPLAAMLVSIWFGLEGQGLRIAALRRRGWREWGVVRADNLDEADLRYTLEAGTISTGEAPARQTIVPDAAHARPTQTGLVLGLPHPSGRP